MRKAWIHFTEQQYAHLEDEAYRTRQSVSEIVRQIVEKHYGLAHETVQPGRPYKSPKADANVGHDASITIVREGAPRETVQPKRITIVREGADRG